MTLRESYPLDGKKPLKKTIAYVWFLFLLFFVLVIPIGIMLPVNLTQVSFFFSRVFVIGFPAFFLLFLSFLAYFYELFYMKYYFYDIIGNNLIIKKGVFSRNEITVAFNRLQDVYTHQDVLDRFFGLYDLYVSSATFTSGELSHIDGLNKENSEIIKGLILERIRKHE